MKRDWNLVREMLIAAENDQHTLESKRPISEIEWHIWRMVEGELIDAKTHWDTGTSHKVLIEGIRWKGCDLLDAMRNESLWSRVLNHIKNTTGEVSVHVLKSILQEALTGTIKGVLPSWLS